jgi:DNA-binding NarL/FixJ family response regulator
LKQAIRLLIIEDSPDDYFFLRRVLESSEEIDAILFHEERLESAIALARREPMDVAIVDLSLPDSQGLETFIEFHARHPAIPTLIMTGHKDHALAFKAVQKGAQDYLFKGDPSSSAIIRTIRYAIERQHLMTKLKDALDHVKQLQGLLPICSACKMIRDDNGYWNSIESYIASHSEAQFTHSICPDCARKLYPNFCKGTV